MGLFNFFRKKEKPLPDVFSMLPKEIADALKNDILNNPQATSLDEIPEGFGEFGLEETNPIPVYGVPSNEIYLRMLKQANGKRITWRRVGSFESPNIIKSIDKYEIFDTSGDTICFLYISPYHKTISNKIPKGFRRK